MEEGAGGCRFSLSLPQRYLKVLSLICGSVVFALSLSTNEACVQRRLEERFECVAVHLRIQRARSAMPNSPLLLLPSPPKN